MSIITIAREAGSLGDEIAERISQKTGYPIIDFDKMIAIFLNPIVTPQEKQALSTSIKYFFEPMKDDRQINFKSYLEGSIGEWAKVNHGILLGIAGQHFLADCPDAIHIRIVADRNTREERLAQKKNLYNKAIASNAVLTEENNVALQELMFLQRFIRSEDIQSLSAGDIRNRIDKQYRKFSLTLFQEIDEDFQHYHMILNSSLMSFDNCVKQIIFFLQNHQAEQSFLQKEKSKHVHLQLSDLPVFKNESEEEFAHLLDLYHIEWKYEPKFFPIEWDEQNNVTMAFSPDFYLPKFNVYLELTTMNQRYVSAKKKKLKRLKELYPGVNVKIIYKSVFLSLIQRFED